MLRPLAALFCVALLAAPAAAQAGPPAAASGLNAKTEDFANLCVRRLQLSNVQGDLLRARLHEQMLALRAQVECGLLPAPRVAAAGRQRLDDLACNLFNALQYAGFQQLMGSSEAVPHLRGLALARY